MSVRALYSKCESDVFAMKHNIEIYNDNAPTFMRHIDDTLEFKGLVKLWVNIIRLINARH